MKGRENNKGIKKYKCGVQKEQAGFFLSVARVNKVPERKTVSCRRSLSGNS
jgi:hypothetical protein